MRFSLWIASLWPGFARAWVLGRWDGLMLGAAFAAALNTGLVATFIWREWSAIALAGPIAAGAWALVLGFWTWGVVWVRQDWPRLQGRRDEADAEHETLFREAQHEYLKGHWLEAEAIVRGLLAKQPNDVEGRLLLASIERRARRWNEATRTLVELREDAAAAAWLQEIESELKQLKDCQAESNGEQRRAA
jgi:hypothetical protein